MGNFGTLIRIMLVLLTVAVVSIVLPKLFPPTEKDKQAAEEEAARRLRRYENQVQDMEEATARREAKKRKKQ